VLQENQERRVAVDRRKPAGAIDLTVTVYEPLIKAAAAAFAHLRRSNVTAFPRRRPRAMASTFSQPLDRPGRGAHGLQPAHGRRPVDEGAPAPGTGTPLVRWGANRLTPTQTTVAQPPPSVS
jgi:hypothetical protein